MKYLVNQNSIDFGLMKVFTVQGLYVTDRLLYHSLLDELSKVIATVDKTISRHHKSRGSLTQTVADIIKRECKTNVAGECGSYVDNVLKLERNAG